ncbi:MAG: ferredoxin--NADP(+) reductase [Robiginitomaculum sp.]|nr:MAG: ferredoxin--NADP(+) reductase [Robiginitomaculum sp.]
MIMTEITPIKPAKKINPNAPTSETVLATKHYTDKLFSFSLSRPAGFRFRSGEFIMIGLMGEKKPLLRAYSIASPAWDDKLDFYSIKVPDGPLTSRLQNIQVGDKVLLGKKPVGTLVLDALLPGKRLFMFSTGTGIAPFASLIQDPDVYENFDQVILTQTCRDVAELEYGKKLVQSVRDHEFLGELVEDKLVHITSVTREDYPLKGRITTLLESGELFKHVKGGPLNRETDRVMICGSMDMTQDTKAMVESFGLKEGSNSAPADFVIEKAFVG